MTDDESFWSEMRKLVAAAKAVADGTGRAVVARMGDTKPTLLLPSEAGCAKCGVWVKGDEEAERFKREHPCFHSPTPSKI